MTFINGRNGSRGYLLCYQSVYDYYCRIMTINRQPGPHHQSSSRHPKIYTTEAMGLPSWARGWGSGVYEPDS